MKLLILRTNIKTRKKVKVIRNLFDQHPVITDWSIDLDDIDNVLRIEARDNMEERALIHLIKSSGFYCEVLPD